MVTNGGSLSTQVREPATLSRTVYDHITDLGAYVKTVGRSLAMSGAFGSITEQTGELIALESAARRCPPLKLREAYHFMFGQLAVKSERMLANFDLSGGKHRWIVRTSDVCELELIDRDGNKSTHRLTWEEAKQEPFVWAAANKVDKLKEDDIVAILAGGKADEIAKKLKVKPKYATPRARMQMLSARVVSDGVRAVFPAACEGSYTPEEVADYSGQGDDDQVVDAEFEVASPAATTAATTTTTTTEGAAGRATKQQRDEIERLFVALNLSAESRAKALSKRGVGAVIGLSQEQAAELITACTEKLASVAGGQSAVNPPAGQSVPNRGPCTQPQIDQAKGLLKELEQLKPGAIAKFKEKMRSAGKEQIKDLTVDDCSTLIVDLSKRALDAFFAASLQPIEFTSPPDGE